MDQRFLDQNRFFFLNTNYTHTHFIRNPNRFECICMCVCVGKVSTRFRHTATQFPRGWDLRPVPKFGGYNGMDDSVFVCVCWTSLSDPQSLALHQSLGVDFFIFAYICREEREKSLGSVGPPKIPNIPGMWVAKFFKDRRKFEFEISNGSPVTHQTRHTEMLARRRNGESAVSHDSPAHFVRGRYPLFFCRSRFYLFGLPVHGNYVDDYPHTSVNTCWMHFGSHIYLFTFVRQKQETLERNWSQ